MAFALAAPVAVDTENAVENFADPEAAYTLAQGSTLKVVKNGHEPTIQTDGGAYVIAEATTGDVTTYSTETAAVSVTDGTDTAYFTTLEEAFGIVEDGDTVTLLANVTLTADAAATPAANANVTLAQGEFSITADGHAIALSGSPLLTVTTDKQTGAFDAAAGYVIVESGSYVYTPTKIVAMIGEKPYTSFEDAVEAVQDGETITVVGYDPAMEAPEGWKFVTDDMVDPAVTTLVKTDPNVSVTDGTTTKTYETLQEALTAARALTGDVTVTFLTDLKEYAFVHQKAGLNLTIDGQGKKLTGQLVVDGDSNHGTDTLTIQNINFTGTTADTCKNGEGVQTDAFILMPSIKEANADYFVDANKYNHAHNVTIKDCTFTGAEGAREMVALKSNSAATVYDVALVDCTAKDVHSLAQLTAAVGVTITGCTGTDMKNGINISGGGDDYLISGNTISVNMTDGYGIRIKKNSPITMTLTGDNAFTAVDMLIVQAAANATVKIDHGVYSGTVSNADSGSTVAISGGFFSNPVPSEYCAANYIPIGAKATDPLPYTVAEVVPGDVFVYPIEGTAGVPVTKAWLAENMSDIYGSDPTAPVFASITNDLVTALSENGANNMPRWESYVLGLDPADATAVLRLAATAKDATTVTITGAIDTTKFPEIAKVTVTFRLASRNADGTWSNVDGCTGAATPSFDVALDAVAGKTLAIFADITVE